MVYHGQVQHTIIYYGILYSGTIKPWYITVQNHGTSCVVPIAIVPKVKRVLFQSVNSVKT